LIQAEKIIEDGVDRYTRCRAVIELAKKGKIEIAASALCLAEVCKNKDIKDGDPDKIAAFFEHEYLQIVALGREISEEARKIMMAGFAGLKPADACHLATAAMVPEVVELHTFDGKLLALDQKIIKADKTPLKVCLPDVGGHPPPLLEEAKRG
jgi:predicted nucleic acid-binding protein